MTARARTRPAHPDQPARPARGKRARAAPAARTHSEEIARLYLRFGDQDESARASAPEEPDDLPVGGLVDQRVYQGLDARHRARVRRRQRHGDECP